MSESEASYLPVAVFAGLDPTGGAGIAADVRALNDISVPIAPVLTANTIQGSGAKPRFQTTDPEFFREQIEYVFSSLKPGAVKIGMLGSAEILAILMERIGRLPIPIPIILDPVHYATSGGRLADDALRHEILNVASRITVLTPNRPELEWLSGSLVTAAGDLERAAAFLSETGFNAIFVKGGHFQGEPVDRLYQQGRLTRSWTGRRYARNVRGTGCYLASCIAGYMARGDCIRDALDKAYESVQNMIRNTNIG